MIYQGQNILVTPLHMLVPLNPVVRKDSSGVVVLGCSAGGAQIRYTPDGSLPSFSSPVYEKPILMTGTTPLLMQAYHAGMTPGNIVSAKVGTDLH